MRHLFFIMKGEWHPPQPWVRYSRNLPVHRKMKRAPLKSNL